jgi:hypothetical protein
MTRTTIALAVAVWALTAARGPAQEKYTLKFREPVEGDIVTVTKVNTEKTTSKVTDDKGNVLKDGSELKGENLSYTTTILKKAAGEEKPTSLRRTYAKYDEVKDGKTTSHDLAGKTVLIEKKGDKYTFRYDGGDEVTGPAAAKLDKEFNKPDPNSEKDFLPAKAVAVGESWVIPTDKFKQRLGPQEAKLFDLDKLKATGRLLKAYKKDGAQFGVLEIILEMPLRANAEIEKGYTIHEGKAILKGTLDTCVDGSSYAGSGKFTMDMTWRATVETNGMRLSVAAQMSRAGTDTQADAVKK